MLVGRIACSYGQAHQPGDATAAPSPTGHRWSTMQFA